MIAGIRKIAAGGGDGAIIIASILRKAAPIVGLTAQFAWGWFAWLLGPDAGGLWILVALYAAVYVHGIWVHWWRTPA